MDWRSEEERRGRLFFDGHVALIALAVFAGYGDGARFFFRLPSAAPDPTEEAA